MKPKPKLRLTKKRVRALEQQLSFDDILYEKFRRLNEDLQREYRQLGRMKRIIRVVQRRGNFNQELQILEIQPTVQGTIVVCR